jgi:hypothetical protein
MDTNQRQRRDSGAYVGAAILIVIGVCALAANLGGSKIGENAIPLAIGVAFMVAYALTRRYGFLVPGGILIGVGAGVLAAALTQTGDSGQYPVIGGGLGFLSIYIIDFAVSKHSERWWPVIPGGIMLVTGAATLAGNDQLMNQLAKWSPVLLIALGVWLLTVRGGTLRRQ